VADLRRLEDFAIERELASETPDWTILQRALHAVREGMRPFVLVALLMPAGSTRMGGKVEEQVGLASAHSRALCDVATVRIA